MARKDGGPCAYEETSIHACARGPFKNISTALPSRRRSRMSSSFSAITHQPLDFQTVPAFSCRLIVSIIGLIVLLAKPLLLASANAKPPPHEEVITKRTLTQELEDEEKFLLSNYRKICYSKCLRGNFRGGKWARYPAQYLQLGPDSGEDEQQPEHSSFISDEEDLPPPCWMQEDRGYFSCYGYTYHGICPFEGMTDCHERLLRDHDDAVISSTNPENALPLTTDSLSILSSPLGETQEGGEDKSRKQRAGANGDFTISSRDQNISKRKDEKARREEESARRRTSEESPVLFETSADVDEEQDGIVCLSRCLRGNFVEGGWASSTLWRVPPCWLKESGERRGESTLTSHEVEYRRQLDAEAEALTGDADKAENSRPENASPSLARSVVEEYFSCYEYVNGRCPAWPGIIDCKQKETKAKLKTLTERIRAKRREQRRRKQSSGLLHKVNKNSLKKKKRKGPKTKTKHVKKKGN